MRVAVFDLRDAISIFYTLSKISELYIYIYMTFYYVLECITYIQYLIALKICQIMLLLILFYLIMRNSSLTVFHNTRNFILF